MTSPISDFSVLLPFILNFVAADMKTSYVPHLDGIRAIALLGVLAFHFKVQGFSGGFLGVDCFLVLSGYLMTRNLTTAIASDSLFIKSFYITRFWRLFPSSLTTILCSTILAGIMFSPSDTLRVAHSAIPALLCVSNFYFYFTVGYFDTSNALKPLLHMWSLSLEEQFYLIWPAILPFLRTFVARDQWVEIAFIFFLLGIASVSFGSLSRKDQFFSCCQPVFIFL